MPTAVAGAPMTRAEVRRLLGTRGAAQAELFAAAREARDAAFGRTAVVRGVVEVTSACVRSCLYCPMRAEARIERYFRRPDEILASASRVREAGLGSLVLQGGDAPATTRTVGEAIPAVREAFADEVELILCLGDKPAADYARLRAQGADTYILKQETTDAALHEAMRGYGLPERLAGAAELRRLGYRLGLGAIAGLPGQDADSLADDVLLPRELGAQMTSVSPFVPAPGTPLEGEAPGCVETALNALALMRLVSPGAMIPTVSALEKLSPGAQRRGLEAGANVITVNFTPEDDRARYPIYGRDRFVVGLDHALATLEAAGLRPLMGAEAAAFRRAA